MARKIKVHKTLGNSTVLVKIERNENIVVQIPLHSQLTDPPHAPTDYTVVIDKVKSNYTLHLTGDHEATIKMNENLETLDQYYYDTAEYVEIVANQLDDTSLPVSMGFELYAIPKTRAEKDFTIRDGNHVGEIFVEYPVIEGAAAYRVEAANLSTDGTPDYRHAGACSITFMIIQNVPADTKFLFRLYGIFPTGEGAPSEAVPFRTREW